MLVRVNVDDNMCVLWCFFKGTSEEVGANPKRVLEPNIVAVVIRLENN